MNTGTKLVLAVFLIAVIALPAYPQKKEILQLQADMIRLQQQVTQMQMSADQNNQVMKALVEKMADQVNTLAAGMTRISQSVDNVKVQDEKSAAEMRTILQGMSTNVGELQEGLSSVRAQINSVSQQVTAKATTVEPLSGPDDIIRTATLDYLSANYDLALNGFQEFLSKYPNDPRAADAQLQRGEAYYNQKKFDQAVIEYDLFLQKFPDNDKSKTALYKKGLALAEQNQTPQALAILEKVVKDFPNTSEATNAQAKVRQLRNPQRGAAR